MLSSIDAYLFPFYHLDLYSFALIFKEISFPLSPFPLSVLLPQPSSPYFSLLLTCLWPWPSALSPLSF